ncbi:MAG: STAS domain-containing protein [Deltaproteobacteria bacterium]|nr:STAS domain-containing protein [Deltaproteobacteria bacterium]MBW2017234.1 STAS domain-containing protein [Deltaproteobacteria bacterium]MBW2130001.1 STAS domain-containing protein [Deltaproteobacteria bacterium]MBW2304427.1 STAS domain-containing protein [Deltaproteobacteria bacterium]
MAHVYEKLKDSLALVKVGRELSSGRRSAVNELRDLCCSLEKQGINKFVLEFSNVRLCPSVVFGNLIVLAKRLRERKGGVAIAAPSPQVSKAARITGLEKCVPSFDSVDEAIRVMEKKGVDYGTDVH